MRHHQHHPRKSASKPPKHSLALPHLPAVAKAALLAVLTTIAYWPALNGLFILDDARLISQNDLVKNQNGIYQIWFTTNAIDYWPVTNSVFWLQWHLFGENSLGYHLINLALHVASCWLIWLILQRLSVSGAYLAAVLFAVHPVNVESVAWISQLKNVLALFFFLVSILWYLIAESLAENPPLLDQAKQKRTNSPRHFTRWYALSLFAFTLAMLSKGSVAILPLVLLLIAYWQHGRINKSDLLHTAPFLVVAVVLASVNVWFQTHGLEVVIRHATPLQRLLGAGAAIWFYLSKALWPTQLAFVYPQWNIEAANFLWWLPLLAVFLVSALLIWQRRNQWCRTFLIAWVYFCIALAPALGFVDVGYMRFSLVADHYQYIALIAVVAVVAVGWVVLNHNAAFIRPLITGLTVAVVGLLALLTWRQSRLYAGPIPLYEDTLAQYPDTWNIQNNLAAELNHLGRWSEGMSHSLIALRLNPLNPEAHYNLGDELVKLNRPQEAISNYRLALQEKPDNPDAQLNLGVALFNAGQIDQALPELQKALPLKPNSFELHNDLATVLLQRGETAQAVKYFEQALKLEPNSAEVSANLAQAYLQQNRYGDALASAQKALHLAHSQGKADLAKAIESWLTDFNSKHPDASNPPPH